MVHNQLWINELDFYIFWKNLMPTQVKATAMMPMCLPERCYVAAREFWVVFSEDLYWTELYLHYTSFAKMQKDTYIYNL